MIAKNASEKIKTFIEAVDIKSECFARPYLVPSISRRRLWGRATAESRSSKSLLSSSTFQWRSLLLWRVNLQKNSSPLWYWSPSCVERKREFQGRDIPRNWISLGLLYTRVALVVPACQLGWGEMENLRENLKNFWVIWGKLRKSEKK